MSCSTGLVVLFLAMPGSEKLRSRFNDLFVGSYSCASQQAVALSVELCTLTPRVMGSSAVLWGQGLMILLLPSVSSRLLVMGSYILHQSCCGSTRKVWEFDERPRQTPPSPSGVAK